MNKIERVRTALTERPVDLFHETFWRRFEPQTENGEAMARVHLELYRTANTDFSKIMNDNPYETVYRARIKPHFLLTPGSHLEHLKTSTVISGRH